MRKKIMIAGVILLLSVSLLCCYFLSPFIYLSSDVKVKRVDPKDEKQIAQVSWVVLTEEQAYKNHSVILIGKVKNVREAKVDYKYEGNDQTHYITLAEIVVSEFFNNSGLEIKAGDTLTVGHGITSYMYTTDVPQFEVGKEYVLFCMAASEQLEDDPMRLGKYVDCWISAPNQLILPKVDDYCYPNHFWKQAFSYGNTNSYEDIKSGILAGIHKYWLATEHDDTQTDETEKIEDTPWAHDAALTRFLQDTNHNGEIESNDSLVPPGTLPEIWQIPAADQSMVGQTVDIILAKEQQAIPFYYAYQRSGVERLAVILRAERIPMLVVFETDLGGVDAVVNQITTESVFQGKILTMTNISYEEGNVYAFNVGVGTEGIESGELIADSTDITFGECVGVFGTTDDEKGISLIKASKYGAAGSQLMDDFGWYHDLFARYSLFYYEFEDLLGERTNWYNRALTSEYENPCQLNLRYFFDNYGGAEPTAEEWAILKDYQGYNENYDFFRIPAADMDQILTKYFGITREQVAQDGFKGLRYLESTNCYYYMTTGSIILDGVEVTNVVHQADGTIHVYYKASHFADHVVVLKPTDSGYQILSNLPVE